MSGSDSQRTLQASSESFGAEPAPLDQKTVVQLVSFAGSSCEQGLDAGALGEGACIVELPTETFERGLATRL